MLFFISDSIDKIIAKKHFWSLGIIIVQMFGDGYSAHWTPLLLMVIILLFESWLTLALGNHGCHNNMQ